MAIKELIIRLFPFLYHQRHFSDIKSADLSMGSSLRIEPELLLLEFFLAPDSKFIDVGSNKGEYIFSASKYISAHNIYGFEPNPLLYRKLKAAFAGVNFFPFALSSARGNAKLRIPFTGGHPDDSLGQIVSNTDGTSAAFYDVQLQKMDDVIQEVKDISLIKMDVEGKELDVLMGAVSTLANSRPVLLIEVEARHHDRPLNELIRDIALKSASRVFYYDAAKGMIVEFSDSFSGQRSIDMGTVAYINNFFFIPSEKDPLSIIGKINSKIAASFQK